MSSLLLRQAVLKNDDRVPVCRTHILMIRYVYKRRRKVPKLVISNFPFRQIQRRRTKEAGEAGEDRGVGTVFALIFSITGPRAP
jgi:hypothetical protein